LVRANVNGGIEGEHGRVHFVDLTAPGHVKSTLCSYSVHFVDLTNENTPRSTKCTLAAAPAPQPPYPAAVDVGPETYDQLPMGTPACLA
jgi:hypothetical protein